MTNSYVMRVSSNGQVSIPAETRNRWHSVVVDLGDRVVIRPLPAEPLEPLVGKTGDGARPRTRCAELSARRLRRKSAGGGLGDLSTRSDGRCGSGRAVVDG